MNGGAVQDLAAIVLAAGLGTRLRPLTELLPKALCPVDNVALVDHALERVALHTDRVAVNVHHHRDLLAAHLEPRAVHVSVERERPLGTAGAVGHLRGWLGGRPALIVNADAWSTDPLTGLVEGWDGATVRLLVDLDPRRADFDGVWRFAGASLLPWADVRALTAEPSGLYEVVWRQARQAGRVELVPTSGAFVDCGTPADYLGANLVASGGRSVVGEDAVVDGHVAHSVVWPGARVGAEEHLRYAIRLPDGRTLEPFA